MKIKRLAVTGASYFLDRYKFLLDAMSAYVDTVERLPNRTALDLELLFQSSLYATGYVLSPEHTSWAERFDRHRLVANFHKSKAAFVAKSKQSEIKFEKLAEKPDFILQIFSMSCPVGNHLDIPYGYYLDYTMALSKRYWSEWASYSNEAYNAWLPCERLAYQRAFHLFPMSHLVKDSLINDYGIDENKITVVGSSGGHFLEPYAGEKHFGSKQLLFNGSDFYRKGGDILLEAFDQVKQKIPEAKLIVVGGSSPRQAAGVHYLGHVSSSSEMINLFLESDLVVAPARCEPYGNFLVEAMNYGVPCVVSTHGAMSEIVDHEINGIVLPKLDSTLLANQIVESLSDRPALEEMSKAARLKVRTRLNWHNIAKQIFNAI